MTINYFATGALRKELVAVISETLNVPATYLGMPTAAYQVGDYTIDKHGAVTGPENSELLAAIEAQGFIGSITEQPETYILTLEFPMTDFTPDRLDNLHRLAAAKAPLIKAALGAVNLPIIQTDDTLKFPWFDRSVDSRHLSAYAQFIHMLCRTAQTKSRITSKEKEYSNPKYAMRCFLISLGMIGEEYKSARNVLLARLDGNSAFRDGTRPCKNEAADNE